MSSFLTHMCFEVLHKFNSIILSFPKLDMSITTCRYEKIRSVK